MLSNKTSLIYLNWKIFNILFITQLLSSSFLYAEDDDQKKNNNKKFRVSLTPPINQLDYVFWNRGEACLSAQIESRGGKAPYQHTFKISPKKSFADQVFISGNTFNYCAITPNKEYNIQIISQDQRNQSQITDLRFLSSNLKIDFVPTPNKIKDQFVYYQIARDRSRAINLLPAGGIGQKKIKIISQGIKYTPELPQLNYNFSNNTLNVNTSGLKPKRVYFLKALIQDSRPGKGVEREYFLGFRIPIKKTAFDNFCPPGRECEDEGNVNLTPRNKISINTPISFEATEADASSYKVYSQETFKMNFDLDLPPSNFIQGISHFYKSNLAPILSFAFEPNLRKTNLINLSSALKVRIYSFA